MCLYITPAPAGTVSTTSKTKTKYTSSILRSISFLNCEDQGKQGRSPISQFFFFFSGPPYTNNVYDIEAGLATPHTLNKSKSVNNLDDQVEAFQVGAIPGILN